MLNREYPVQDSADKYFKLKWDTRVANLSFARHFGNPLKTNRHSSGSAGDETLVFVSGKTDKCLPGSNDIER